MSLDVRLAFGLLTIAVGVAGFNWLVFQRTAAAFRFGKRARRIAAAVLAVPLALSFVFRMFGSRLPIDFASPAVVVVSTFELGVLIAGGFLGLALVGRSLVRRARRWRKKPSGAGEGAPLQNWQTSPLSPEEGGAAGEGQQAESDAAASSLGRRAFVEKTVAGGALLAGGGSVTYGALFGRHDYELSTVPVPIPGLSKAADGFTLVQISDIHLGQMVGEHEMRAAEELVRKAGGDLIVVTGDLIDHDARYAERLGRLLRRLREMRPVVVIPGNHDYYTGAATVLGTARAAGATVLVNQAETFLGERGGFVLAGLDDQRGEGPDLEAALAGKSPDLPRVVLCHNPKHFEQLAGQMALMVSGHTHGGQINLGLRPADLILRHGFIAGLYERSGSHIYVNRGFGTAGAAVRVGAPPEVTRIVLVSS